MPRQLGERDEVVEPEHAEPGGSLEQQVEQVGRREGVIERTMGRRVVESES